MSIRSFFLFVGFTRRKINKNEKIIDIDSSGGLQMVIALTLLDVFQRNLFYYKINTNCSSEYESLGFVGLLWDFFFCLPWECWDSMGIGTSVGTRVVLLGAFLGLFGLCFGPGVRGLWRLVVWVAKVLKQTFVVMIKSFIVTGRVLLSLFRPVVYGLVRLYACIRKTPRINIG